MTNSRKNENPRAVFSPDRIVALRVSAGSVTFGSLSPRSRSQLRCTHTAAQGRNERRGAFQAPNRFECTIETLRAFLFWRLGNRPSAKIVANMNDPDRY